MIKAIMTILKNHLGEAYDEGEQWEAIIRSPWDIMARFPSYDMFRRLSHDLIKAMKMEKCKKHIRIPDQKAAIEFIRSIIPTGGSMPVMDEDFLDYHARYLRRWLLDWNTTAKTYRDRQPQELPLL